MSNNGIRVTVCQPALAHYRVPVFAELASRELQLRVQYAHRPSLRNAEPSGFIAIPASPPINVVDTLLYWERTHWRIATKRDADVLVIPWSIRDLSLTPTIVRARGNGVAVVLWGHGYSKRKARWRAVCRNAVASMADALVVYDPDTKEALVSEGLPEQKIFVAINTLDIRNISAARSEWIKNNSVAEFRKQMDLHGPVILFVSRLSPQNRLDLLLRALRELRFKSREAQLVVIGPGTEERASLVRLAEDLAVSDLVRFLDGTYDESSLTPWFLAADVFCYPANAGLSVIHSLAYGLPVVTTNNLCVQNPEARVIVDGVNGFLYEHGSAESLAECLTRALADPEFLELMGRRAEAEIRASRSVSLMVDGLEAAIRYAATSFVAYE